MTNYAECSRFLGSLTKTTFLAGKVQQVLPGKTKTGRNKTDLRVQWVWLDRKVVKVLALRSVRAGPPPSSGSEHVARAQQVGTPTTQDSQAAGAASGLLELARSPAALNSLSGPSSSAAELGDAPVPSPPPPTGPLPLAAEVPLDVEGSVEPAPASSSATYTAHGVEWKARNVSEPVGGPVPRQAWSVRTLSGEVIHEEGDTAGPGQTRKPYDYFMSMFREQHHLSHGTASFETFLRYNRH